MRALPKPKPKTILRRLTFILNINAEDELEENGTIIL